MAERKDYIPSPSPPLPEKRAEIETPEPLSGREVAKIVEELYKAASVRLTNHLVESNVVLTVAGTKGTTNDPGIRDYVERSGQILKDFYESDWHKKISQDKVFLALREE